MNRLSRAVLLPIVGDPYQTMMWLHNFDKWSHLVDKLYVNLNHSITHPVDKEVINFLKQEVQKRNGIFYHDTKATNHGEALTQLLLSSKEELILLSEMDAFVLDSTIIDSSYKIVEQPNSIIKWTRGCAHPELLIQSKKYFNLDIEPHFWPLFFFAHRNILLDTDLNFSAKEWKANELITELDWVTPSSQGSDTFVWTSIQIRGKNKYKFYDIDPKIHASMTSDIDLSTIDKPLIHLGNSSGAISHFKSFNNSVDYKVPTNRIGTVYPPQDQHIKQDYARKLAWWTICFEKYPIPVLSDAYYFNNIYKYGLDCIKSQSKISDNEITPYYNLYKQLGI